ncbi:MAG: hypothetical protein HZA50_03565 [Planctomycetes bacterium]|nr:hypothetical protein [Planctomycetota bacterium]
MRQIKMNKKEFRSYDEYKKTFFPKSQKQSRTIDDPAQYGIEMARQSLKKLRQVLC